MSDNGKKRKAHSPQFKAEVALAAIQNDQIASRFGVHPTMISNWKRQMLEGAVDIFDKSNKSRKQEDLDLMRKIDELYLENPSSGSWTIRRQLKHEGLNVSRKRIQRLMCD